MAGYTGLKDMVDGGGPGQSGSTFSGGGVLSSAANTVGLKPIGSGGGGGGGGGLFGGGGGFFSGNTGGWKPSEGDGPAVQALWGGLGPTIIRGANAKGFMEWRRANGQRPPEDMDRRDRAAWTQDLYNQYLDTLPNKGRRPGLFSATGPRAAPPAGDLGGRGPGASLDGDEVSRRNAQRSQVPTFEAGGYVGPDGQPIRPSTASMDLPPSLARMLDMPMQSYAEGGMVGAGGMPQRPMGGAMASPMAMDLVARGGAPVVGVAPPGQAGRPLNFAAIDQQAQQFMQQNPQQVQQIRAQVEQAMAAGEVDAQSLNMFVQIATTALQNPEMWPQLRQVLIRQGMLDAEDIGEEYDQGFLIVLYIIGKSMGNMGMPTAPAAPGQGPAPMSAGQPTEMSMKTGGPLPAKSKNPDGSIPINAHEGEYVIPADVTRRLGTDHFDKLIAKARGADDKGEQ